MKPMNKTQSGNLFIFTDENSDYLESQLTNPPGRIAVYGTVGEFNSAALASLLQIAPAFYSRIFGLTYEGLLVVANKFDTGATSAFAQAILGDKELFGELMSNLVKQGIVRQEKSDEGTAVYFPTELYLQQCNLLVNSLTSPLKGEDCSNQFERRKR